jgi:RNA polymerase sigma-70 factor (ECF subfamily)
MDFLHRLSDAELLERTAREPQAFAAFYDRHERLVLRFLMIRCRDAELTADLAGETFACALEGAKRFDPQHPEGTNAVPWLLTIAHNTLRASVRRGVVAEAARRRLRFQPLALDDEALERIEYLASLDAPPLEQMLGSLPQDLRDAVVARVIEERDYDEIAAQLGCSQQVVRKRVSRGLTRLRSVLRPAASQ